MKLLGPLFTILLVGGVGALVYTLVTHPQGVTALGNATDNLLKTSFAAELGKVA